MTQVIPDISLFAQETEATKERLKHTWIMTNPNIYNSLIPEFVVALALFSDRPTKAFVEMIEDHADIDSAGQVMITRYWQNWLYYTAFEDSELTQLDPTQHPFPIIPKHEDETLLLLDSQHILATSATTVDRTGRNEE